MSEAYPKTPAMKKEWSKKMAKHDEKSHKGFNIKRDKGGKGFSLVIRKKIRGFEEEKDMPKDQLNELKPATLRSYTKQAAPEIWDAGVDLGAAREHRPAKWAEREMEKQGRKVQKRVQGVIGAQERLGGEYHAKVQSKKNIASKYPAYNVHKYHANEYEPEGEVLDEAEAFPQPAVADLVAYAIDQKPLEFSQTFAELMQQHIADEVYNKKLEIAAGVMGGPEDEEEEEESQYVAGDEPEESESETQDTSEEE